MGKIVLDPKALSESLKLRRNGMKYQDIEADLPKKGIFKSNGRPYNDAEISSSVVGADPSLRVKTLSKKKKKQKRTKVKALSSKKNSNKTFISSLRAVGVSDSQIVEALLKSKTKV